MVFPFQGPDSIKLPNQIKCLHVYSKAISIQHLPPYHQEDRKQHMNKQTLKQTLTTILDNSHTPRWSTGNQNITSQLCVL